ncbi:hypothetical protein AMTRI_Chr02g257480 [Amborella trichopoda]
MDGFNAHPSVEHGRKVYRAATKGNWRIIDRSFNNEPRLPKFPYFTIRRHNSPPDCAMPSSETLVKILDVATEDALSATSDEGNTILHEAAIAGNIEMVRTSKTWSQFETIDVFAHLAVEPEMMGRRSEGCLRRNDGATIVHAAMAFKSGTIYYPTNIGVSTSIIMETIGKVIYTIPETPFFAPLRRCTNGLKSGIGLIYQGKLAKQLVQSDSKHSYEYDGKNPYKKHNSTNVLVDGESKENGVESPLILATKKDIVELVRQILKVFPEAIEFLDKDGKSILHLAAEYRAEKVFKMLRSMGAPASIMVLGIDNQGNSVLHLAPKLQCYRPPHIRWSSKHMQWDCGSSVKHVCPPCIISHKNMDDQTAQELFTVTHKSLLKEGNQPNGLPTFLSEPSFRHFMDYLERSLFASSLSLAFFTSILTTRCEEEDFYFMLSVKYIVDSTSLWVSTIGGVAIFSYSYIHVTDGIYPNAHLIGKISFFISMSAQIFIYIDSLLSTIMYCVFILIEDLGNKKGF